MMVRFSAWKPGEMTCSFDQKRCPPDVYFSLGASALPQTPRPSDLIFHQHPHPQLPRKVNPMIFTTLRTDESISLFITMILFAEHSAIKDLLSHSKSSFKLFQHHRFPWSDQLSQVHHPLMFLFFDRDDDRAH